MTPRRVAITGVGVLTPIGTSCAAVLEALLTGASGIRLWESASLAKAFPAATVAERFENRFKPMELPLLDRCTQMAILAAQQALSDAGVDSLAPFGTRAGVYYGTVRGGLDSEEAWAHDFYVKGRQSAGPFTLMGSMLNAASAQISIRNKACGPVITYTSACASSGVAIGEAFRAIRDGHLDVALAGGAEAPLTPRFFGAWEGVRALAPAAPEGIASSCRPFAKDRAGLVIGEGAVLFVLEPLDAARARGAKVYALVGGYGCASDAFHVGAPKADGQIAALRATLADAALAPEAIDYYNAHGTGTAGGDPVEAAAVREVFGERVPVSSTKAVHGHLLGATGAMELAVAVLAIQYEFLPATAFLHEIDPECRLNHVAVHAVRGVRVGHALSFSAGFGGTNAGLIVSRFDG